MIRRKQRVDALLKRLHAFPVVAILGPRQIGKTTLARQVEQAHAGRTHRLDLKNPTDLNFQSHDPVALQAFKVRFARAEQTGAVSALSMATALRQRCPLLHSEITFRLRIATQSAFARNCLKRFGRRVDCSV